MDISEIGAKALRVVVGAVLLGTSGGWESVG